MRRRRLRVVEAEPMLDPLVGALATSVSRAATRNFAEGWMDGAEDALRLALGEDRHGAEPYRGPSLPSEFVAWAQRALTKLKEGR